MEGFTPEPPPKLGEMFVRSVDTLHGTEIDLRVAPASGWNDRPPLLVEKGNWRKRDRPEDLALLKGMLRKGVPDVLKCALWLSNVIASVHPHQPPEYSQEYRTLSKVRALDMAYENLLKRALSNNPDDNIFQESTWKDFNMPTFGNQSVQYQQDNVAISIKRVLVGLDQIVVGTIEYCPILPTLCELLLTHMSESYVFCALREMSHAPNWYFPTYQREYAAWVNAFCDILERLHPTTAYFYKNHGVWNVEGMAPLFRDFFTTLLPHKCVLRILDLYTLEGSKVIFRFGVALLTLFKMSQNNSNEGSSSNNSNSNFDSIRSTDSLTNIERKSPDASVHDGDDLGGLDVWEALKLWANDERFNFEFLVKKAYGVHGQRRPRRFPRRHIIARIIKMEEVRLLDDPSLDVMGTAEAPSSPLGIAEPFVHPELDRDEVGNYTLKPPEMILGQPTTNRILLAGWLAPSLRMTNLELLFSTNHHGRTLDMFYTRVGGFKHTILLAEVFKPGSTESDEKTIIGCYASQAWRLSNRVYGDGECFLFRLSPDPKVWKWHPRATDYVPLDEDSSVHESSKKNKDSQNESLREHFMVGTANYISMGGNRDGSSGLSFNEDLTRAESGTAVGFENEPLAGFKGDLDIGLVEVYGLKRQTWEN